MADEDPDRGELDYWEQVASRAPARLFFSMEESRASVPYFVNTDRVSLEDAVPQILGTCRATGKGGLARTLPKAHPRCPFLFAHAISDVTGLGSASYRAADEDDLEAPLIVPGFADYDLYVLSVDFSQRPYAVLSDESVGEPYLINWTQADGAPANSVAADEYLRFTDYQITPAPEIASAQQGQMLFRAEGGDPPNGVPFSGFPRIVIPKALISFDWYQVPFDYIDDEDSFITDYIGTINQADWYGFPAGSLLYSGCQISKRYTPPFPERTAWYGSVAFSTSKLCDVRFVFEYTKREAGSPLPTPSNENWIAAGHNLLPWLVDKSFHYATSEKAADPSDTNFWLPTYLSFPFALLFSDPAAQ